MVGLDYGRRRIGVAASDPSGTIAAPHSAVETTGGPDDVPARLLELLRELEPTTVVIGIPRRMDGSEGDMAREARTFGRALAERADLPVVEWDERLTTALAERQLREMDVPRRKRRQKGRADMLAAAALLRSFLSSRPEEG